MEFYPVAARGFNICNYSTLGGILFSFFKRLPVEAQIVIFSTFVMLLLIAWSRHGQSGNTTSTIESAAIHPVPVRFEQLVQPIGHMQQGKADSIVFAPGPLCTMRVGGLMWESATDKGERYIGYVPVVSTSALEQPVEGECTLNDVFEVLKLA